MMTSSTADEPLKNIKNIFFVRKGYIMNKQILEQLMAQMAQMNQVLMALTAEENTSAEVIEQQPKKGGVLNPKDIIFTEKPVKKKPEKKSVFGIYEYTYFNSNTGEEKKCQYVGWGNPDDGKPSYPGAKAYYINDFYLTTVKGLTHKFKSPTYRLDTVSVNIATCYKVKNSVQKTDEKAFLEYINKKLSGDKPPKTLTLEMAKSWIAK